jgi:protein TonB
MENSQRLHRSSMKTISPGATNPSVAGDIVEMVVVTRDEVFLRTLRNSLSGAHRLWHVASADKVSELLIAGQVGILVLDVMALNEPAGGFLSQIKRQFPDLVMIVAGKRKAEVSLGLLISSGTVYRFIHKPMSPARARQFADAAVKKYAEQRLRPASPPVTATTVPRRRGLWLGAAGVALTLLAVAGWALVRWHDSSSERVADAPGTAAGQSPLLTRAAAALAANRLTQPNGDNALQLYQRLLALNPADPAARAGLAEVRERLAARADNDLLEERLDEAGAAIDTARRAGVDSARIAFLSAELTQARGRRRGAIAELRKTDEHATEEFNDERRMAAAQPLQEAPPPTPATAAEVSSEKPSEPSPVHRDLDASAETQSPKLVKSVAAVYPRKAEKAGTEGWVDLDFTVAADGTVHDIEVRNAQPAGVFDSAAVDALAQWRYQPPLRNGVPSAQRAKIRVRFALAGAIH